MDTETQPIGNDLWLVTDLLGRKVGTLVEVSKGVIFIEAEKGGVLDSIQRGPFVDIEGAMTTIERKTRGTCRLVTP